MSGYQYNGKVKAVYFESLGGRKMILHAKNKFKKVRMDVRNLLMLSCKKGNKKCLALMMSLGANLDIKDDEDRSLLQMAYASGRADIVECIVTHDANIRVNLTKFIDKWNKKKEKTLPEYNTSSDVQVAYNNV